MSQGSTGKAGRSTAKLASQGSIRAFAWASTDRRMPSTLAVTMSGSFDLALRDIRLIRERVRRRGGDPAACCWPAFWLEGAAYDYVISGLDAVARVDGAAVTGLLDDDEHAFLLTMMVLVHARPAANAQPRPPLEESYLRHEGLIAGLVPSAQATGLPVAWHALWRLPPAMTWSEPGGKPWMRYPAVSFMAAVRPLQ